MEEKILELLNSINEQLDQFNERLDQFRKQTEQRFDRIEKRISEITDEMNKRHAKIQEQIDKINKINEEIDDRLFAYGRRLEHLETDNARIQRKDEVKSTPITAQADLPDNNLWRNLQKHIKERVSTPSYETWFKSAECVGIKDNTLLVQVPNAFAADWLNSRYKEMVEGILMEVSSTVNQVKFMYS